MRLLNAVLTAVLALQGIGTALSTAYGSEEQGDSAVRKSSRSAAVQKAYKKGQDAYEAKRYEEAEDIFQQILRKESDHTPSRLLLARSQYQLKKMQEAYNSFKQLEVQSLDSDASYECGQSAYRAGDYALAMAAFQQIPNGHGLFDLAGYYGGISAFKRGDYQAAIDLFEQAVVLPNKLVKSQKLYAKEAEKQLLLKQKREARSVAGANAHAFRRESPTEKPFDVIRPRTGFALRSYFLSQTSESKEALSQDSSISSNELRLDWGTESTSAKGHRRIWQITLAGEGLMNAEKEIPVMATPERSLELRVIQEDGEPKSIAKGKLEGDYEAALSSQTKLGLRLGAYTAAAESDFVKRIGYAPFAKIFVAQNGDSLDMALQVETHPQFDDEKLLLTETKQTGRVSFALPSDLALNLQGELSEFSYNTKIDGPDWNGRIFVDLAYSRTESTAIAFGAFYDLAQGWRVHNYLAPRPVIRFDQAQTGIYMKGDMQILSWWKIGIHGQVLDRSISKVESTNKENPVADQNLLLSSYPGKINSLSIYTEFSKTF